MIIYGAVKSLLLCRLTKDTECDVEMAQTVVTESVDGHLDLDMSDIDSLHTPYQDVLNHKSLLQ